MTEIVLEGHFDAVDRAVDEFPLLPFEVPPGTTRLHVRYQVSRQLSGDKVGWQEGNIGRWPLRLTRGRVLDRERVSGLEWHGAAGVHHRRR